MFPHVLGLVIQSGTNLLMQRQVWQMHQSVEPGWRPQTRYSEA